MLKFFERFFPDVDSYKSSGLGLLSFQLKLFLVIAIFIAGVICLGSMSISYFNRHKQEFSPEEVKQVNQWLDAISEMKYLSTTLLNECVVAARYEHAIKSGSTIKRFQAARQRLDLKSDLQTIMHKACEDFVNAYTNYTIFEVTQSKYLDFRNDYRKLYRSLLNLENDLLQKQALLLRTRVISSIKFTGIMFVILLITLVSGCLIIITAIKSMVYPVRLIIKQLQKDEKDPNAYLKGISTEGMGVVAYHLKEAELIWDEILDEFKDVARKLDEQCIDLIAGIKVQEVSEVQIHEAYKAIDSYVAEQVAMTNKANEQVIFLVTNLSSLQRIPYQLKSFVEQIQNLLNTMEAKLDTALNTPLHFKDCALEINSLFEDLGFTSMKILEVVNILTEVAGQAELLAFNTAIEAARAGIKGLGFGVVSKEIAKLVERSQKAAVDLNSAVNSLHNGMNAINQRVPQATITAEKTASFQQVAREVCRHTFETIRVCINDLLRLNQVFEEMITKSSELTKEANQIMNLEFKEKKELQTMELEVIDYQLNVKESVRIAGKIDESIGILKFLLSELHRNKSVKPDLTREAS